MIFKQWQQVLNGTKTQTRRPVKVGSEFLHNAWWDKQQPTVLYTPETTGDSVIKWQVGRTYAVQPGGGKKSVGRIRITKIRREKLWDISAADCDAEGIASVGWEWGTYWQSEAGPERSSAQEAYEDLWESIYRQPRYRYHGYRWKDNPDVWVLDFELVEEG